MAAKYLQERKRGNQAYLQDKWLYDEGDKCHRQQKTHMSAGVKPQDARWSPRHLGQPGFGEMLLEQHVRQGDSDDGARRREHQADGHV